MNKISFTEKQKSKLLEEFNSLKTISEKFKFWESKLNMKYVFFLSMTNPFRFHERTFDQSELIYKLQDFTISPEKGQSFDYNTLVIEEYKTNFFDRHILEIEDLILSFQEQIDQNANKELFIDHQIKEIDRIIFERKSHQKKFPDDNRSTFFLHGYERQYFNNEEPDLSFQWLDYPRLIELLNGNTWAKFRKYLDSQLKPNKAKSTVKKEKEISLAQQILLLQFLGVFEKINKNPTTTKKASFLSSLLNKNSQTIRELYSEGIHSFLNADSRKKRKNIESDLKIVHRLFNEIGLIDEAKAVESELKNL